MNRLHTLFLLIFIFLTNQILAQINEGLIGYWPFVNNANDVSGYNNHGVVYGATLTEDRFGNSNSAYLFNGNTNYINCGSNIPTYTNRITISVWIKTNTQSLKTAYIVGQYGWTNGPIRGFHVLLTNLNIQFAWRDEIDQYNFIISDGVNINDDQWHHIVGTLNNSLYELWIDGVKISSDNNYHSNVDISQTYDFYIGGHFNHEVDEYMYFPGAIDDIRLYNRTLSDSEIIELFNETNETYTVTTTSNPTNGGTTSGDGEYLDGQSVTVTATANDGYGFVNWTENNIVVSSNSSYTFNINANRNLVANFSTDFHTISTSSNPPNGGTTSGGGTYSPGSTVTVSAIPNIGYNFSNWTENGIELSTNPNFQFTVTRDRVLVANFWSDQIFVTTTSNPTNGGTASGGGAYSFGSNVTVTATPAPGYVFINWTENGSVVSSSSSYTFTLTSNRNLVANFMSMSLTLSTNSNPENGGTTTGDGIYNYGTSVTVTATPANGYIFINWTEGNQIISTNISYTFTITDFRTLTANFLTIPEVPILADPTFITQTSFTLNWNKVSTATGYYLDVAIDNLFNNILSTYNNKYVGNVLTYTVGGLTASTNFYTRVRAYNAAGVSSNSSTLTITTLPNAPTAPIALNATDLTPTGFTANWNQTSGAAGYFIDIAIDSNFVNLLTSYKNKDIGNVNSCIVTGLATNMTYYYRIRAYNEGGTSGNSNTISVTIYTDIEDLDLGRPTSFILYQNFPNPFNPTTTIQFSIPEESFVQLKIYNTLGVEITELVSKVLPAAFYSINFDASTLESGVYYYRLNAGDFSQTRKFILLK